MSLQIPNRLQASAVLRFELDDAVEVQPTLVSSTGFTAAAYDEIDSVLVLDMNPEVSRLEAMIFGTLQHGFVQAIIVGPPLDPTGLPAVDNLQANQLGAATSFDWVPLAEGSQMYGAIAVYRLPLLGV